MTDKHKQHSVALAGYSIIALIFTYPLLLSFNSAILGSLEDNVGCFWNMWWVKHALFEGKGQLFFTDYIFYPSGINLAFNSFAYTKTVLSVPLQYLFDSIAVYNILSLFSYVFSGFGVYLLVNRLVKRPGVAFVSGLIYTLSPTHVWHLDHHLDVGTIEMIPFFLFFFIRFYETERTRDLVWAGVFFVLTSLSCWYYMMYLLYFLALFFIYFLVKERQTAKAALAKTAVMIGGALAALFPFLYPLIKVKLSGEAFVKSPGSFNCVTDLVAAFVPSGKHPLAGWLGLGSYYKSLPCFPWETNVFIGYTVLLLAVYGFVKAPNRWTRFMALMGGVFWVLSLGSHLQLGGQPVLESLFLPYYWLVEKIPLANSMRTPARFMAMVMLALAVLYGYGLDALIKSRKKGPARIKENLIILVAGLLVAGEFISYPQVLLDVEEATQARYLARNLTGDDGEYAVLELPMLDNYVYNLVLMHRQTRHHKKLIMGHMSRVPVRASQFIDQSPLGILKNRPAKADLAYFKSLLPFLQKNRIKFIIVNRYFVSKKYADFLENSLRRLLPAYGEPNPRIGIYQVYN